MRAIVSAVDSSFRTICIESNTLVTKRCDDSLVSSMYGMDVERRIWESTRARSYAFVLAGSFRGSKE